MIAFALYYFNKTGIPLKQYPEMIKKFINSFGVIGPLIYILVYTIRPLVFFPATLLTMVSGLIFGPVLGVLYIIVGENLSANVSFLVGRYFGKNIMENIANKSKMFKFADCKFKEYGFIAVLTMRLVFLPFDLVGYMSGMCNIKQGDFALGTFIGIIPGFITFVVLGASFTDPRNLIVAGVFFVMGIGISKYLKKKNFCKLNS